METNKVRISNCIATRRLDPIFYRCGISRFGKVFKLTRVGLVVSSMQSGFAAGKENQATAKDGIIQVRPTNIDTEGELIFDKNIYVPADANRPMLMKEDIVFNNTNSQELVGKSAMIRENKSLFFSNHITRIRVNKSMIIPDYLCIILNIYQREKIFFSICTNWNNQSGVNIELLKSVEIPLPPLPTQQKIVDIYNKAKREKQEKEEESQRLLDEIDTYLLAQLGIELPEEQQKKLVCKVSISQLLGNKLDVRGNFNRKRNNSSLKYDEITLGSIASIKKGQTITRESAKSGDYPVIAGGQTSPYFHQSYNELEGAITISASGAYAGFVWYHDYKFFASDCIVIRSLDEDQVLTSFLYEILKLKQTEIYLMQRGAGQPHVYSNDIAKIMIPNVPIVLQNKIVSYVNGLRNQSEEFLREASIIMDQARQKIEQVILN